MSALFKLQGDYSTKPLSGSPSGDPAVASPILEQVSLSNQSIGTISLDADGPVTLPLGALTQVNVIALKSVGGRVTLRYTSADGTDQAFPVDSFIAHITQSAALTAITVERVTGIQTIVNFFLGERST